MDDRSAKELARAFVASGAAQVPSVLSTLLASNQVLGTVEITEAVPEALIHLDAFAGETRNSDLAGVGIGGGERLVAFTVEAKADEEFGDTISTRLTRVKNPNSNVPQRIESLSRAMFGRPPSEVADLRYQLLHGAAASLVLAGERGATAAIFIVFEFRSKSCNQRKLDRNAADLDWLATLLGGVKIESGVLQGPFGPFPGGGRVPSGVPLYVGKAVRYLP